MGYEIIFAPMATVKNDSIVLWTSVITDIPNKQQVIKAKSQHKFSTDAQKRFVKTIDNMANIYEAGNLLQQDFFTYKENDHFYRRKPVHLTLTLPDQGRMSDYDVKEKLLHPFLMNLRKTYDITLYIWKAEAQLRGAIHFHVIIDKYIDHYVVRKLWWRKLKEYGLNGSVKNVEHASKISHIKGTADLGLLKLELGGYFGARNPTPEEFDKLKETYEEKGVTLEGTAEDYFVYKHDPTKVVRQIEGGSWGSADLLRYRQFTFGYDDPQVAIGIAQTAIDYFPIEVEDCWGNKKKMAEFYQYKKVFGHGEHKKVVTAPMESNIQEVLRLYHFTEACKIYGGRGLTKSEKLMLYNNHSVKTVPSSVEELEASRIINGFHKQNY